MRGGLTKLATSTSPTRLLDHLLDGAGIGLLRLVGDDVSPLLPEEFDDRWTE
jgi:hypothetical protein